MFGFERKIWAFVREHLLLFLMIFVTLLSLLMRYSMRDYVSDDMICALSPWYDEIRAGGGLAALGRQVGNYNIPYQTLIALLTYLPIAPLYGYKIISVIFDYLLAAAAGILVWKLTKDRLRAVLAYAAVTVLPPVIMNSAMWAQCDAIFTFFCLVCVICLLDGRYSPAFIAYGAALAFKLQAVFLLPFLFFFYAREKKFSFLHFLWIPAVMMLLSLGGILQGRGILSFFTIYFEQTQEQLKISSNYPSFWNLMVLDNSLDHYPVLHKYCILFTLAVLAAELTVLSRKVSRFTSRSWLKTAFFTVYTCVLFLPNMHERYSYLYLILGLIIAVLDVKTAPAFLVLLTVDMQIYNVFLLKSAYTLPWTMLVLVNIFCFAWYGFHGWKKIARRSVSLPASGS